MQTRKLGKSKLNASIVGLGCWQLGGDFGIAGPNNTKSILEAADDVGISFWDTADVYGAGQSESSIGQWTLTNNKARTIVTKLGRDPSLYPNQYTKSAMRSSIEVSLSRLQVDAIDLIQLHCIPPEYLHGDAVWHYLEDFRAEGLIKHYGASVENINEGLSCLDKPGLSALQIIFNLFRQDAIQRLLPQAAAADVGIIVRLPLSSGLLSGKFKADTVFEENDHRHYNKDGQFFNVGETFSGLPYTKAVELVDELKELLPKDAPLAQLALRWILDHPQVTTVIAGASSAQQVRQNAQAASLPSFSEEQHNALSAFYFEKVRDFVRGSI
ncbi:aldo/keto reductase [Agaribacter flavus]|uniref:Aldo/keto reductase n=1 Tax=Agaribacter flavus TaxID=1902781 RepID=A0ABV7FPI1_9ALTE